MGKKATKKFVTSGKLKKTIQARHKAKDIKKKIERRRGNKGDKGKQKAVEQEAGEDDVEDETPTKRCAF